MKKSLLFSLMASVAAGFLFYACGGDEQAQDANKLTKGKGPVYYGGVFKYNEVEKFRSLYPLDVTEEVGFRLGSQIYEGLVKFNQKDLTPQKALASSWEVLDSGTRYVFHLRKGVMFHDDACFAGGKGREVTAKDVKWCYDKLCEPSPQNQLFGNTFKDRVVGASDYYKAGKHTDAGVSGITVDNDTTISIRLINPHPSFLTILCTAGGWIYPKEALEKYQKEMRVHCVGTGPFKVESIKEGETVLLTRNANYYMVDEWGNQLPYLSKIRISFQKERNQEMISFRNNQLEMIYRIPVEMMSGYMGKLENAGKNENDYDWQSENAMSLTYYGFQNKVAPFDNVNVRKAFCYAINRASIAETTLKGDALAATNGVVPPSIPGYGNTTEGFTFDEAKAKQYLADAGYPGGKNFPEVTLQINTGGNDRNKVVAESIQSQLRDVLNINVKVETMQLADNLESIETGKAKFWRTGWIADYPDADNFLILLYGKNIPANINDRSYLNSVRYSNPVFDSIYEAAMKEQDPVKRNDLYHQAERTAMADAPLCPVYYEVNDRLVKKYVQGLDMNKMEYRDFTRVYLDAEKMKKK